MMLKGLSYLLLGVCISCTSFARPLSEVPGWEFTLNLNVGYSGGQSQFNTDKDNAITENLDNSGKSLDTVMAYPLGRVQYTLKNLKTQFYLGNSRDQVATGRFQYEIGIIHQFSDKSKLTFAVFPKLSLLDDTWADPFLVGSARQETKQHSGGGRIQVDQIFGSPVTLKYALAESSIENELSGQSGSLTQAEISSLNRDSLFQRVEVETMFPVAKGTFLKPNFQYTHRNAEGNANSYAQYTGQLSLLIFREKHLLVTTISAGVRNYQEINPIFNAKQDLTHTSIFSIYSYKKPFNWDRWSWTIMAGYNQENSEITFYSNDGFIVSTGLAYKY